MKSSAVLASFALIVAVQYQPVECAKKMDVPELQEMLKPMSKSCQKKTGVSNALIDATRKGDFQRERPLMCYFKCLSVMLKVMSKQGEVSFGNVEKQINTLVKEDIAPRLINIGKECYNQVPKIDDACEYAFEIVYCGYRVDPEMYFLP